MLSIGMYIIGALLVIAIIHYRKNSKFNGKLPPGSMGWPLLGETFQFFEPNTSFDISPFVKKRMDRYGPIFRTNLVGHPIIVSTDPDFNYFIFNQEGQLFQSWYPQTFAEIFGRQNIGSLQGFMYKYLKNMVIDLFGIESLKKMLPEVENVATNNLKRWSRQTSVEMKEASAKMIFDISGKKLMSYNSRENMLENFVDFTKALISFPLGIPGTSLHKCLQGVELNGASRNFMAFGGGMRFCVGTDFAKLQMPVFLHCFLTNYKWEPIKGGDIVRANSKWLSHQNH